MNFYEINAGNLTIEECDKIALEDGGVVKSTGYSYAIPKGGDINEEYSSKVTNTRGMGNHGKIILVGKTPRSRRMIRLGKIKILEDQGISRRVASMCVVCYYGMEIGVAKLAQELCDKWSYLPKRDWFRGHNDFDDWCNPSDCNLTFPRKQAAFAIAEKINNGKETK